MAISLTALLIETEGHNRTRAGRPEGDFDPRLTPQSCDKYK